ncbi:MAG: cytochrome oxidase small assembly protein [Burkholderiaceae bacterium]
MTPQHKRSNFRLAMILASVAIAFMLGIVVKIGFFGG